MRNKAFAAVLGLLLPAFLGAQEVRVSQVARTVAPIVQPSAMAASAVLAAPALFPTLQPSLQLVNPVAALPALPAPVVGLRPVIAAIIAPAVAVDYPGVPNESLQGADRSVV